MCFLLQIRPLAKPTRFLVNLQIDQYSWHDIVSKSKPQFITCAHGHCLFVLMWNSCVSALIYQGRFTKLGDAWFGWFGGNLNGMKNWFLVTRNDCISSLCIPALHLNVGGMKAIHYYYHYLSFPIFPCAWDWERLWRSLLISLFLIM